MAKDTASVEFNICGSETIKVKDDVEKEISAGQKDSENYKTKKVSNSDIQSWFETTDSTSLCGIDSYKLYILVPGGPGKEPTPIEVKSDSSDALAKLSTTYNDNGIYMKHPDLLVSLAKK